MVTAKHTNQLTGKTNQKKRNEKRRKGKQREHEQQKTRYQTIRHEHEQAIYTKTVVKF